MKTHLQGLPTKEQVIACVVRMLNGVLGQRGQLLNEVSPETVALRLNGFVAEFSMWLPPISTSGSDAGLSYAGVITRTLSRLSYGEVREYVITRHHSKPSQENSKVLNTLWHSWR